MCCPVYVLGLWLLSDFNKCGSSGGENDIMKREKVLAFPAACVIIMYLSYVLVWFLISSALITCIRLKHFDSYPLLFISIWNTCGTAVRCCPSDVYESVYCYAWEAQCGCQTKKKLDKDCSTHVLRPYVNTHMHSHIVLSTGPTVGLSSWWQSDQSSQTAGNNYVVVAVMSDLSDVSKARVDVAQS